MARQRFYVTPQTEVEPASFETFFCFSLNTVPSEEEENAEGGASNEGKFWTEELPARYNDRLNVGF